MGSTADLCPAGYYCIEGTDAPTPCPEGTYSPTEGLHSENECLNCTGGYFCNQTGLTSVTGKCNSGYYCTERAHLPTQELCPMGSYCPIGSVYPTSCLNGTFSNATGLQSQVQCTDCTEGYYCNGVGLVTPSGLCKRGYYCPTGSEVETQIICPIGRHCPEGSAKPKACSPGSYTDYQGAFVCTQCPEGYYCIPELVIVGNLGSVKQDCPEGFYCPNGTHYNWQPCPRGTFSNSPRLRNAQECSPCDPGYYCGGTNLTQPTAKCSPGYYCVSGIDRPNPRMLNDSHCPEGTAHPMIGHICPAGHFCTEGSITPTGCAPGKYQVLYLLIKFILKNITVFVLFHRIMKANQIV